MSFEKNAVDAGRIPEHIAIIMDGNGRWARRRLRPRSFGHRAGMEALRRAVQTCGELGVRVLTVYAFSTENWKRPQEEISFLMGLLQEYLGRELQELHRQGVVVRVLGDISPLDPRIQAELRQAQELTAGNRGLVLNIALNYGGRRELVQAARRLAARVERGELRAQDIDEAALEAELGTAGLPDPDLLIRTAGEMRVSNFLLWQIAYTELVVLEVLWPDFGREHLLEAIREYQRRDRRFGALPREEAR